MHPTTPESPARAAVRALRADEWAAYFADLERRKRAHASRRRHMDTTDHAPLPLARTADLYYRENGAVFGPLHIDTTADMISVTSVAGIVATFPRTAAGLDAAVLYARKSARVGENYSGAIDFILRKSAVARHGRGSLVR